MILDETKKTRLIYCDENFAIVNKIPGEECSLNSQNLENVQNLKKYDNQKNCQNLENVQYLPNVFASLIKEHNSKTPKIIECVNRIDKPVSGLVILALTDKANADLSNQLKMRKITKKYFAIVEGVFESSSEPILLTDYLTFNTKTQKAYIAKPQDKNAKKAQLLYKVIGQGERYSFLEVELLTGRTHQIRCQLAAHNMHIKGDLKYGSKRSEKLGGIRLHAAFLSLFNPKDNKLLTFNATFPYQDALWQAFPETHS